MRSPFSSNVSCKLVGVRFFQKEYSDNEDMKVGTTQLKDSSSILTGAANNKELSQGSDVESEVSGYEESIFR